MSSSAFSLQPSAFFSLRSLSFAYGRNPPVLRGLELYIQPGEFVGIIGPNGVGKSTLLHLMTGWLKPTTGTVEYKGRSLAQWDRRAFAREVGVVTQREESAFPFTAEEVVLMGRYAHQPPLVGFDDPEDRAIARGVLDLVGLGDLASRRIGELSGGERQRVFLARALAQCPSALLLDEPTSSLDLCHQRESFRLLDRLSAEKGITVVVVTHDINLAALYCKRLIVLEGGAVRAQGTPAKILEAGLLEAVYRTPLDVSQSSDGTPFVVMRK